jgi:hypothetical protein
LRKVVLYAVRVIDVEEAALRPAEEARVVLDGVALGGRVDDAEHFLEMGLQELVVEDGILLLEGGEKGVLGQVVAAGRVLLVRAPDLLLQRLDALGKQAGEAELDALVGGERGALVEVR